MVVLRIRKRISHYSKVGTNTSQSSLKAIVAMSNADSCVIAIDVSDKMRRIEGIDKNEKQLNELLRDV